MDSISVYALQIAGFCRTALSFAGRIWLSRRFTLLPFYGMKEQVNFICLVVTMKDHSRKGLRTEVFMSEKFHINFFKYYLKEGQESDGRVGSAALQKIL